MICKNCNAQNDFRNDVCFNCNAPLYNDPQNSDNSQPDYINHAQNDPNFAQGNPVNYYNTNYYQNYPYKPKSKIAALLLCIFLGYLGIHRFYVGKVGTGLLYMFTFGLFGIGIIVDIVLIATGAFTDSRNFELI